MADWMSEADRIAYERLIDESDSKKELAENLRFIRNDIIETYGGGDSTEDNSGGRQLTKNK